MAFKYPERPLIDRQIDQPVNFSQPPVPKASAGSFNNGQFVPSEYAQEYLNKFIEENPKLKEIKINSIPLNEGTIDAGVAGYFRPSNPNSIFLNPETGSTMTTFVHELQHAKNNADGVAPWSNYSFNQELARTAHQWYGNFKDQTKQLLKEGYRGVYFSPSVTSTGSPRNFDPNKDAHVMTTGMPIAQEELSARQAEKKLLESKPKYKDELQQWKNNSWTSMYPASFIDNLIPVITHAKYNPGFVSSYQNSDLISEVTPITPPGNTALKLALEAYPVIDNTYDTFLKKTNETLGVNSNLNTP